MGMIKETKNRVSCFFYTQFLKTIY
jgi:hypothetical protein